MDVDRRVVVRLLFAIYFLVCNYYSPASAEEEWSYDDHHGQFGPSKWSQLASINKCGESSQSPIDLRPSDAAYVPYVDGFVFHGYDVTPSNTFTLRNNGHTVLFEVNSDKTSISGGGLPSRYRLVQVHMHWGQDDKVGSEHTMNAWTYPLEIHFVHFDSNRFSTFGNALNQPSGLAVLGVFAWVNKITFHHEGLQRIIDNLRLVEYKNMSVEIEAFPVSYLLPKNRADFYRYRGSLTTPPCYEGVIWTVFRHPINISSNQLWKLRTLRHGDNSTGKDVPLVDNYRPVQPLNGRTVLRTFEVPAGTAPAAAAKGSGH